MGEVYKGATPTLSFTFPETIDLTLATDAVFTCTDGYKNIRLEKTGEDLVITPHQVDIRFTQEETLSMPKAAQVQANFLFADGSRVDRVPSKIVNLEFETNLKPEVME